VFLSLTYGEGEAHASLRLREEKQKRHERLGTDSLDGISASSLLPFPRNQLFIGREDKLRSLGQLLLSTKIHQRMAIYGLGGCGKLALALEFAYRALARHARRLVFWVPAISQESFERAYREIGIRLRIPGITDDNVDIKKLLKDKLSSDSLGNWLMIVDNADDPGVLLDTSNNNPMLARLSDCLPRSTDGTILFTTRNRKTAVALAQGSVLELSDMSQAEAGQLLAQRITKQALLDDETAVKELPEILTYLPLAIVQAAAFINNNDISVSGYVTLFLHAGVENELFGEDFEDTSRYQEMDSTIAKTWYISFDQIRRQDRLAAEYLSFMACIDRNNIPQSLLSSANSSAQQVKALGTLKGYALITERQQARQQIGRERFFDTHRLVHMASVWWLESHDEWVTWVGRAVVRLEHLVSYGGHEKTEIWTTYLSHAIYVAGLVGTVDSTARASLLDRVGECKISLKQCSAAEMTHRHALFMKEKVLGPEHPDTLMSMSNLAVALGGQGKYEEEEEEEEEESINRKTLVRREKVLGPEHPGTLRSVNRLARLHEKRLRYSESMALYERAYPAFCTVLGNDHPTTRACRKRYAEAKLRAAEAAAWTASFSSETRRYWIEGGRAQLYTQAGKARQGIKHWHVGRRSPVFDARKGLLDWRISCAKCSSA
ncbi:hypothetical protein K505DRAFT_398427, partial [Melanomma pulvis-pyrius CBS 109.77]